MADQIEPDSSTLILDKILEGKPTIHELCEHIDVGTKWYHLGVLLKLNTKQLDAIEELNKDVTYKTTKMFEMWLTTNPTANRRQLIDVLRKPTLAENTVANEYKAVLPQYIAEQEEMSMPLTTRPVQQQRRKINPSKIFRSHSADLCDAIEAIDHSRLAFRLFSQFLIDDEFRNKITELNTTPYKKAEMIVNELQRQLESAENNSDPVECLEKICEVLVKMKDDTMIHIADDIRRQLEMHENTEEIVLPIVEETDSGDHLEMSQLDNIIATLKRCYVSSAVWNQLGLSLGLYYPTLDAIDKKYRGDPTDCLKACLRHWLEKEDKVMANGGPTWSSLVNALRTVNKAAAEKIKKEKC